MKTCKKCGVTMYTRHPWNLLGWCWWCWDRRGKGLKNE